MPNTTRWQIPYPADDNSDQPLGPAQMKAIAVALDDVAKDDQGTLANRPVSSPATPGKRGRYYFATDEGALYRDNGTGWDAIGANTIFDTTANRPAANAVPAGQRFFSTDQIAEWISDGSSWIRLGSQAGEIAMTVAAAATPGKILLQGQAWPSTTGIYAELFAKLGGTSLPNFQQYVPVGYKAGDADFGALLHTGGEKTHTLTAAEIQHHHQVVIPSGTHAGLNAGAVEPQTLDTGGVSLDGPTAHNNLQPFIVVNFEAKL